MCVKVKKQIWLNFNIYNQEHSKHFDERAERILAAINCENTQGLGKITKCFLCNTGHSGGDGLHVITKNAIIIIINAKTHRLITLLIA